MEVEILFHSIELGQAALGETPEGFDPIDVDAMRGKMLVFVDPEMLVVSDINSARCGLHDRFSEC